MSRNTDSHFGNIPMKNIRRSSFKMPCTHSTTANTGQLIPIYSQEVLPGDTCKMKTSMLVRMQTPIVPVMDNAWIDTYFFYVPRRLVWSHWRDFMGENRNDAWTQETEYQIPQLITPEGGWIKGTVGEKLYGVQGREGSVDACYARAFALIYNEWFRNENLCEPLEIYKNDVTTQGSNGYNYVTDVQKGGDCPKVMKYADYFTRALPEPQKGPDVYLPLGTSAPLTATTLGVKTGTTNRGQSETLHWTNNTSGTLPNESYDVVISNLGGTELKANPDPGATVHQVAPSNLEVDLTGVNADLSMATAATINQLRQAFAVQRMYEIDARGGTRYTEILRAHFGVISSDARQQRPEYLGGKRTPVNISQVIQQSATDATSPQGTAAAYSLTIDSHEDFTKSFEEHGMIIGVACVRTEHTYQQGFDRKFNRKNRTDFYWPELANIGEQPIYNKEIFAQGTSEDDEVFGYQEPWAEYRYMNNRITGELNSDYQYSLDIWHYGDNYEGLPILSDPWIKETDLNVKRSLAIQNQDQWKFNFYFDQTWIRPLPIYSIPSLAGWN